MCAPLAVAAVAGGLQIGGAIANHQAQKKQAKAVRAAAHRNLRLERRAIAVRQIQEGIATSEQLRDIRLEAERREGSIRASAAASGVQGDTIDALIGDLSGSEGRAARSIKDTYVATLDQLELEKQAADARAAARIAGAPEPSALATGIRIGGAVTETLTNIDRINANRTRARTSLGEEG